MADHITDALDSMNHPSISSFLNRLPTKKIDAAINKARDADIPEQGEQTGGYTYAYSHFSHIPLMPLYSDKQTEILEKQNQRKQAHMSQMDRCDPDKNLTSGQKLGLSVMGMVSGGGGIVSTKRWERRLVGASVVTNQMIMDQHKLVTFTRWTLPVDPAAPGQVIFVDVIEHRFLDQESKLAKLGGGGNIVYVKVGLPPDRKTASLKLLGTEAKGLKSQKLWSKKLNKQHCESMVLVDENGKELAMEIAARIQRAASTLEANEMLKRFEKTWEVPVL